MKKTYEHVCLIVQDPVSCHKPENRFSSLVHYEKLLKIAESVTYWSNGELFLTLFIT